MTTTLEGTVNGYILPANTLVYQKVTTSGGYQTVTISGNIDKVVIPAISPGSVIIVDARASNKDILVTSGLSGSTDITVAAGALVYLSTDGRSWSSAQGSGGGNVLNPYLNVTAWFIDPQNVSGLAKDSNTGLDNTHPLRTLAELTRRIGEEPTFPPTATVTIHMMSDTNATDPFYIMPDSGILIVLGASTVVASGTFLGVNPRVQASATRWSVLAGVFAWAPYIGFLIEDTTNPGFFFVDTDMGAGQAQVTQPMLTSLSATAARAALMTPGGVDNFNVIRLSVFHVQVSGSPVGPGAVIFQRCNISSVTGATGEINFEGGCVFEECSFSAYLVASTVVESDLAGIQGSRPLINNCYLAKGGDIGDPIMVGGALYAPFVIRARGLNAFLDGGLYIEGTVNPAQALTGGGRHQLGDVGIFCTSLSLGGAGQGRAMQATISVGTSLTPYSPKLWGTTALSVHALGWILFKNTATADIVVTGAITLAGLTTGTTFDPATNTWATFAGPFTTANIDASPNGRGVIAPMLGCGIVKEA